MPRSHIVDNEESLSETISIDKAKVAVSATYNEEMFFLDDMVRQMFGKKLMN